MELFRTLLAGLLFSATLFTQAAPTLTIVTEHWPPNNYRDDSGQIVGPATEKVHQLLTQAGIKYEIQLMPWVRAYNMALKQPNTGIYSIIRSSKREPHFQWVCPLIPPTRVFIFKLASRSDIKLQILEDIKKYMISVSRNEFDQHYLEAQGFIAGQDFYVTFDDLTLLRKLLNGRIELMMGTEHSVKGDADKLGLDFNKLEAAMEINTGTPNQTCLAFSLTTPKAVVDKIRQALRTVAE